MRNDEQKAARVIASLCVGFAMVSCGASGAGGQEGEGPETWPIRRVIGAEGGTLEIPSGTIQGLKVTVPPGAVAQPTTFSVDWARNAPSLPAGLRADYSIVTFSPAMKFSKDLEITFPVTHVPTGDGQILGAWCWHPTRSRWGVIPPRRVEGAQLTVAINELGTCNWGIVPLAEVDAETMGAWADDLQNMTDGWIELKATLTAKLQPVVSMVEDPSFHRCAMQDLLRQLLQSSRDEALRGVAAYLGSLATANQCKICNKATSTCLPSVCDANLVVSGQPFEWLREEAQIWFEALYYSSMCPIDILAPAVEKIVAWVRYQEAIRDLKCDWRCVLTNGDLQFYSDVLLGNIYSFSLFGLGIYQSSFPCLP